MAAAAAAAAAERDLELQQVLTLKDDLRSLANGDEAYSMRREPTYEMPTSTTSSSGAGWLRRWVDSFRRDPLTVKNTTSNTSNTNNGFVGLDGAGATPRHHAQGRSSYDLQAANYRTANSLLARELKGRHLQMIAIGGSIGTGLFISSGSALYTGGPLAVLLAYLVVGAVLYCVMQALGELAVAFPIAGSFSAYSTRFLDPAWGFAMGWNYALQWLIVLPLEIIAASITISYWNGAVEKAIFVAVFLAIIMAINLCGVRGYGEAEFFFAIVKVTAVIGFILLGIVINIGGGPTSGYIGGKYWHDPGPFHNGFKGLCSVFVTAAFSYTGTEMVGLAAAEAVNPRRSLPTAIKQVFWRISIFYTLSLTLVGLLVPYNDERLLGSAASSSSSSSSSATADSSASPFVIAIQDAGIHVLPSVMNLVILIAVLSVGNSAVFGSSRTIAALADQGQAPRCLAYVDRRGRPLAAIGLAGAVGLLAFLADLPHEDTVLNWLLAISTLSSLFTWASICLAHIRFRAAWRRARRHPRQLAFRARAGVAGSYLGLAGNLLILAVQFWVGAWPVDYAQYSVADNVRNFFLNYTAAPVVVIMYSAYKLWFRTRIVRLRDMDITTGRRDFNLPVLVEHELEERRAWPRWKKWYKFFC